MLAGLVESAGVGGRPREWFCPSDAAGFAREWGVSTYDEYLAAVLAHGTTPNGVFGAKLLWSYFDELLAALRALTGLYDEPDAAVLEAAFPRPAYVWIRREDVVAQAVSWSKAAQTDAWRAEQPEHAEPAFDADQIDALVRVARVHNGAWRRWFAQHGIRPLALTYERLCAEPEATTREVLAFAGVEAPAEAEIAVPDGLERQANGTSENWGRRYRAVAHACRPRLPV